jgi:hypothetical protein
VYEYVTVADGRDHTIFLDVPPAVGVDDSTTDVFTRGFDVHLTASFLPGGAGRAAMFFAGPIDAPAAFSHRQFGGDAGAGFDREQRITRMLAVVAADQHSVRYEDRHSLVPSLQNLRDGQRSRQQYRYFEHVSHYRRLRIQ